MRRNCRFGMCNKTADNDGFGDWEVCCTVISYRHVAPHFRSAKKLNSRGSTLAGFHLLGVLPFDSIFIGYRIYPPRTTSCCQSYHRCTILTSFEKVKYRD